MKTLLHERIMYPFGHQTNPHLPLLQRQTSAWIDQYQLPPSLGHAMKQSAFDQLTALFYPHATPELLIPCGRLMVWVFVFDDVYCSKPLPLLRTAHRRLMELLQGDQPDPGETAYFTEFATALKELQPYVNKSWMERFTADWAYFFEGQIHETSYSYKYPLTYPTIREFSLLREKVGAAYPFVDLAEIETGLILPDEIYLHPAIQQARYFTSKLTTAANDILSVVKELRNSEALNLVSVIQNELGCSQDEAFERAVELHNQLTSDYLALRADWPDFGEYHAAVDCYVQNLELIIAGHLAWYEDNERYK
ncbi:terpene synthase family protein [Chitinophaga vietnamensis]|uniref:terpene synthase family protein n=1 Tax=Chitinophaga vietnamensis TaxID=2593957 RepID=UPI0011775C79|nr:hypothetical protein [Chitinophaga vietnamensis]